MNASRRSFAAFLIEQRDRTDAVGKLARRFTGGRRRYSFMGILEAMFTTAEFADADFGAAREAEREYEQWAPHG
jgi:hypothetical protein